MMIFDDDFLQDLKHDPISGAIDVCESTFANMSNEQSWKQEEYDILMEAYLILDEMNKGKMFPVNFVMPSMLRSHSMSEKCSIIHQFLQNTLEMLSNLEREIKTEKDRLVIRSKMGVTFVYEFSKGDLIRVQTLINELRDFITSSEKLEADHQRRLLKRLEALQSELHKRISDLDRFWGLIGDAGVVLGKLGNDAKPIVDRIRELVEIVWNTQGHAEELPSGMKLPLIGQSHINKQGDI